jgi:hypothetical protein
MYTQRQSCQAEIVAVEGYLLAHSNPSSYSEKVNNHQSPSPQGNAAYKGSGRAKVARWKRCSQVEVIVFLLYDLKLKMVIEMN